MLKKGEKVQAKPEILKLMTQKDYRPLTGGQFVLRLSGKGLKKTEIRGALNTLEEEGKIVRIGRGRYTLSNRLKLVTGRFQANQRGYGFVTTPAGDVYISRGRVRGAMHSDRVAVRLLKKRRRPSLSGEIVRILERGNKTLVGRFVKGAPFSYVVPVDRRIFYRVPVQSKDSLKAVEGDIVVAEIIRWPERNSLPRGRVLEVLGDENSATVEVEAIVRSHRLRTYFPKEVIQGCEQIPNQVLAGQLKGRKNFRDRFTVTIDGLDAKDFDDAVSVKRDSQGNYFLDVHIADVSFYVETGSSIDMEAKERGTSVYLVDRVLPMLPPKLSNGICSLNPEVDRLSFSVEMKIDSGGNVKKFEITEGAIRSDKRLSYEEVDELFKSDKLPDGKVGELLTTMRELSDVLEEKRLRRGSLNFETVEPKVILNEEGRATQVILRERTPATKLIEETMILTNETVASFMYGRKAPMIYRVHQRPDEEDLAQVGELLVSLGYPATYLHPSSPQAFQQLISYAHKRPERLLVNTLLLRSMKQARYAPICDLHFGLASPCYSHFTSPIRRYPDLVVHRLVKSILKRKPPSLATATLIEQLGEIAESSSTREREADEAERDSVEVKLCELMSNQVGEVFKGVITGVARYGFFVQLPNTAEGLVHVTDLTDDHYRYSPKHFCLRGQRTGRTFRLGQKVKVQLVRVIEGERRLDLVLVE